MGKRGSNHVEMILSFVIFVAAIGFAFYFFRPGNSDRLVESSFDYIFREIEQNASSDLLIYSVKINNGTFSENPIGINLSEENSNYKSKVFKTDGEEMPSENYNGIVYINSAIGWNAVEFVSIVLSKDFNTSSSEVGILNESHYSISSSLKEKTLSERKLRELGDFYESNYTELKKQFNIPGRVNFGWAFKFANGEETEHNLGVPENLEVFVQTKQLEIMRENGRKEFGELRVEVW